MPSVGLPRCLAAQRRFALRMRTLTAFVVGVSLLVVAASAAAESFRVRSLKITVLSTMLADGAELGEWGFAALVEADGYRLLFDTGARPNVVLENARSLKIDLTDVDDLVLSHWHGDHVGGLMTLRQDVRSRSPNALGRAHVAEGIFDSRRGTPPQLELNPMVRLRGEYEATGGKFVSYRQPAELRPGVWLTGPVPRRHDERNWSGNTQRQTANGLVADTLPDDMSLVVDTGQGLVILTGCGHAGIVNIVDHARSIVRPARIHAIVGGVHLFNAKEETLAWTVERLRAPGVDHLLGAHCTGIETMFRLRELLGLTRSTAVVAAVGASFELGRGINPRVIAR